MYRSKRLIILLAVLIVACGAAFLSARAPAQKPQSLAAGQVGLL